MASRCVWYNSLMKICCICKKSKTLGEFSFKNKTKEIYSSECKSCHKEYNKNWYNKNSVTIKERVRKNTRQYLEVFNNTVRKLKESKPCKDCGKYYPHYIMDFDHLRDKKYTISRLRSHTIETVLKEIEKCEVVCSNCHRERTWSRKHRVVV